MLHPNFVILGALISLMGGVSYLVDTVKGKVKPNRVTWFLWALAPLIAFVAEIKQGVGIQSLMTFMVGFIPLLVFLASFVNKKSEWKLGKLDIVCGLLSLLGIFLWYLSRDPNVAIFFALLADGLAAMPTIVKSYYYPETESYPIYLAYMINAGLTLLTINIWNFAHYGFPLYIFILDLILIALIKFRVGSIFTKK